MMLSFAILLSAGCTKEFVINNLKFSSGGINAYDKYDNVVNIVWKYENLFSKDEIVQLKKVEILSNAVYADIKNIIGPEKDFTKILINIDDFLVTWDILEKQYIIAYNIIKNHIDQMDVADVNVLKMFDKNVRMVSESMENIKSSKTSIFGEEVDVTTVLENTMFVAKTLAIIVATF